MSESDERLDAVSDKIDEAKGAAKSLAGHDVIDSPAGEDDERASDHEATVPEEDPDPAS